MGILDEAIREHLALKRRQGLSDDELQRLEDEAFGPPARPGEPDFPDQELEETRVQPLDVGDDAEAISEPAALEDEEPEPRDIGLSRPPTEEAEPPRAPDSEEAVADPGAGLFDHAEGADFDIGELELELDEESAEAREPEQSGPPAEEAGGVEAPIESLETVEHSVEELEEAESDEFEFAEPESDESESDEIELDEPDSREQEPESGEPDETAAEGEDVLEETPDFLRDAPEDDELWFEQGEPKDFDF